MNIWLWTFERRRKQSRGGGQVVASATSNEASAKVANAPRAPPSASDSGSSDSDSSFCEIMLGSSPSCVGQNGHGVAILVRSAASGSDAQANWRCRLHHWRMPASRIRVRDCKSELLSIRVRFGVAGMRGKNSGHK